MVDFWRIQVTSFGQPGRTDGHPEDASGLLVVASRPDVGAGQSGAHDWMTPAGLLCALGMDRFGLCQPIRRIRFTQCLRGRARPHSALPAFRVEPAEGGQEGAASTAKIRHHLCPSEREITGRDLREPFLHHRCDERAVAREHAAARDRTAARARRHVLRVEQPLVDAERSMKPHAMAEARLLHFRADPRHAVRITRDVEQRRVGGIGKHGAVERSDRPASRRSP